MTNSDCCEQGVLSPSCGSGVRRMESDPRALSRLRRRDLCSAARYPNGLGVRSIEMQSVLQQAAQAASADRVRAVYSSSRVRFGHWRGTTTNTFSKSLPGLLMNR